jgi:hypothetical protein
MAPLFDVAHRGGFDTMIAVLNLGRVLMMAWIAYTLVLLFEPALLHHAPDPIGASIQALVAFGENTNLDGRI